MKANNTGPQSRIPLQLASPAQVIKPYYYTHTNKNGYKPIFPYDKVIAFCKELSACSSLKDSLTIIKRQIANLPHWTYYTNEQGEKKRRFGYWRRDLALLLKSLKKETNGLVVFGKGNNKLGKSFTSFSTLPIFTCPGAGECATYCYSLKTWMFARKTVQQIQNTLLIWYLPDVIRHHFHQLPEDKILRLYVDGDIDSLNTIRLWGELLKQRPKLRAFSYTKSWDLLWQGREYVPKNWVINISNGGKPQLTPKEKLLKLPFVRGSFVTVSNEYKGLKGFARYGDEKYHNSVVEASPGSVSCPGFCETCQMCSSLEYRGQPIAIGVH